MSSSTRVNLTLITLVFVFPFLVGYFVGEIAGTIAVKAGFGSWGLLALEVLGALIAELWVQMLLYPEIRDSE